MTEVIRRFVRGTVSDDGSSISIYVDFEGGDKRVIEIPYGQVDWLVQSLLFLTTCAYDRQVAAGQKQPISPPIDAN